MGLAGRWRTMQGGWCRGLAEEISMSSTQAGMMYSSFTGCLHLDSSTGRFECCLHHTVQEECLGQARRDLYLKAAAALRGNFLHSPTSIPGKYRCRNKNRKVFWLVINDVVWLFYSWFCLQAAR